MKGIEKEPGCARRHYLNLDRNQQFSRTPEKIVQQGPAICTPSSSILQFISPPFGESCREVNSALASFEAQ
jgi:hypothetical protein